MVATSDSDGGPATATPGTRRTARSAEMTQQLLDAAESLYADEGPRALTNRRISERAGTTTQSVYTYFGSRDALVEAMYRRVTDSVHGILSQAASLVPAAPEEHEIIDAFRQGSRAYRAFCLTHPGRFKMIRDEAANDDLPAAVAELREQVLDVIAALGRSGPGTQTDGYESRVRSTVSAIHGFITAELTGFITDEHDRDALFDELVDRLLAPNDTIPRIW